MLLIDQPMFLLVTDAAKPKGVLRSGTIVESSRDGFIAKFDDLLALDVGLETLAYGEVRGKFFQQGARLMEIRAEASGNQFVFQRVGEPVSAEQRQTFRVSVALCGVHAQVNAQTNCHVVDFSPEGLAIITKPGLNVGSMLNVALAHQNDRLVAAARVQTLKILADGKIRYGLLVPGTDTLARKSLLKMTMFFQRAQLKRLAGAA